MKTIEECLLGHKEWLMQVEDLGRYSKMQMVKENMATLIDLAQHPQVSHMTQRLSTEGPPQTAVLHLLFPI